MGRIERRRNGFTLVELLVVIAIITVLAAILLPALMAVKARARKAVCASNMKQVAVALLSYSRDWNKSLPWACPLGTAMSSRACSWKRETCGSASRTTTCSCARMIRAAGVANICYADTHLGTAPGLVAWNSPEGQALFWR